MDTKVGTLFGPRLDTKVGMPSGGPRLETRVGAPLKGPDWTLKLEFPLCPRLDSKVVFEAPDWRLALE